MPRGDRTGPMGQGSMTGRGLGDCAGNGRTGGFFGRGLGMGRGIGRGVGRGLGYGFGLGAWSNDASGEANNKSWFDAAINGLKNQLKTLEQRRKDLDE